LNLSIVRYTLLALVIAVSLYAGLDACNNFKTGMLYKIINIVFGFVVGLAVFNVTFAVLGIVVVLCNQRWW